MSEGQYLKVSVIVPVYKVESELERCVKSLIDQNYKNMDIILVDDGSPDNCPQMCDEFATQYKNIIALHKKNGGLADARNYGVLHSSNEWIVFVDSDDYVEPDYVETLVNLKSQFDADLVITRIVREKESETGRQKKNTFDSYLVDRKKALYNVYSGTRVGWSACGKLLQRRLLLKHPFPMGYYEDCACMYKIIDEVDRIAIGDFKGNYHYVQRDGSILVSNLNEKHMLIFDIVKKFEGFINEKYPELNILVILFYKRAVIQLLNLQTMPWITYKNIFLKFRPLFRKNVKQVLKDENIGLENKIYYLLLCSSPKFFYVQRNLIAKMKRVKAGI